MLHNGHRSKSPIDCVEPKVRREVIHQVVIALPEAKSVAMTRRATQNGEREYLAELLDVLDVQRDKQFRP